MKKCVICNNEITNDNPKVFFEGLGGVKKEICSDCEKQIDIMMESDNEEEAKSAVNYLYNFYLKNDDEEVKNILKDTLDVNSKEIIQKNKEIDYFKDNCDSTIKDVSGWIKVLKVGIWIYIFILAMISILILVASGFKGVLLIIVYGFVILMVVAFIKIFINMSEEVTYIKKFLISSNLVQKNDK